MEYCMPYNMKCIVLPRKAAHPPGIETEHFGSRLRSRISWLFTPEPSDGPSRPAAVRPATWKDCVKGFFWVAISIGIGMALAIACS